MSPPLTPSVAGMLALGSVLGVVLRILLGRLPAPSSSDEMWTNDGIWFKDLAANMLGSFMIALVAEIQQQTAYLAPDALAGVTSGFCGSLTTFSAWMLATADNFFFERTAWDEPAFALGSLLLGFATAAVAHTAGFFFGRSRFVQGRFHNYQYLTPGQDPRPHGPSRSAAPVAGIILLALAVFAIALSSIGEVEAFEAVLALILGPLGAIARYLLAKGNDPSPTEIPAGTLVANLSGSVLLAVLARIDARTASLSKWDSAALAAIGTGFCGSLTTVSTFVHEFVAKTKGTAVLYVVTTVCLAQGLMSIVFWLEKGFA